MYLLPDIKSLLLYTYCLVFNKKLHESQKGKKKISVLRHKITEQTQTRPLCLKYPTEFKVTMINLLKSLMKMQTTCKNRWEISAEKFCFGMNCPPLNSYVKALNPNVAALGGRSIRKVIKVK